MILTRGSSVLGVEQTKCADRMKPKRGRGGLRILTPMCIAHRYICNLTEKSKSGGQLSSQN